MAVSGQSFMAAGGQNPMSADTLESRRCRIAREQDGQGSQRCGEGPVLSNVRYVPQARPTAASLS